MGFVIYGVKEVPIEVDEFFIKCPSCEVHAWADILIISRYVHFYWIPFFPIEKEANIICKTCGLKRNGMPFDKNLTSNYEEVKGKYKNPWFAYTGIAIFVLICLAAIIAAAG